MLQQLQALESLAICKLTPLPSQRRRTVKTNEQKQKYIEVRNFHIQIDLTQDCFVLGKIDIK